MPHNLEAERAVLGAVLVYNESYDTVASIVQAKDFYRLAHQFIFQAITTALQVAGGRVDVVTLKNALERSDLLEDVGGPVYIAGLVDGVPRSLNAPHYAAIVKEKAQLRGAIVAMSRVIDLAYAEDQASAEIVTAADRALVALQANGGRGRMFELKETQAALLDNLEWRRAHAGEVTGITTGFDLLNQGTLGWQPGELVIIGARPSVGKTSFVMNGAVAAAALGKRVAVFSLEMRRIQLEYRLLSSLSGVPLSRCLSGQFMEPDYGRMAQAAEQMRSMPIWINDQAGLSIWDIRAECRRLKAEQDGLDLVVIDYVQLIAGSLERKGANRQEQITDISNRSKTLADELQVPIVLLSQLSRAGEKREDPWPQLSDLRESGSLEQDADLVAFLHRKKHLEHGLTYFILAKQRNGEGGTFKLNWDGYTVTFTEWSGPEPAADAATEGGRRAKKTSPPKVVTI